ncbi:MAG TPA: transporter substrate-binding domain-containing protein [Candidatus Dormibacteraeota bacterium]|nr:transporter substrate-binding domain-containing protein [Candidatus Dormibacteraeota bacterium]
MKRFPMVLVTTAMTLAACGGTSTTPAASSSGGPSKVASIAAEVPSSVPTPIQIATDATYAPNESINPDTGAIEGWDIDFGKAICRVMGVACTFNNLIFADIIPQLKASSPRYLFSISSYTPTQDRENGGIDFISYYKAGEAWIVKTGGPTITTAADMCGHTVAVESTTTEESDAWGFMGKQVGGTAIAGDKDNCPAGKDITVTSFDKQTDANSALLSGRAEIMWVDQPVADYQVKQSAGKFKLGGQPCSVSPYGIALVKGSPLEKAITDAVKYLMDNGYYTTILNNWGVTDGAIKSSDVKLNDNSSIGSSCVPSY